MCLISFLCNLWFTKACIPYYIIFSLFASFSRAHNVEKSFKLVWVENFDSYGAYIINSSYHSCTWMKSFLASLSNHGAFLPLLSSFFSFSLYHTLLAALSYILEQFGPSWNSYGFIFLEVSGWLGVFPNFPWNQVWTFSLRMEKGCRKVHESTPVYQQRFRAMHWLSELFEPLQSLWKK